MENLERKEMCVFGLERKMVRKWYAFGYFMELMSNNNLLYGLIFNELKTIPRIIFLVMNLYFLRFRIGKVNKQNFVFNKEHSLESN